MRRVATAMVTTADEWVVARGFARGSRLEEGLDRIHPVPLRVYRSRMRYGPRSRYKWWGVLGGWGSECRPSLGFTFACLLGTLLVIQRSFVVRVFFTCLPS